MKRFARIVGILTLFATALAYFAFRLVFFDPFEDAYGSLDHLVPRDADLVVRRLDLAQDFHPFPMPEAVLGLRFQREWRDFANTKLYEDLEQTYPIAEQYVSLEEQVRAMHPVDPIADLLGRETMIVGRFREDGSLAAALLGRASFRTKAAAEALAIGALRGLFGDQIEDYREEDGVRILRVQGGETLHLFRRKDLLVVGNDGALVQDLRRRADEGGINITDSQEYRRVMAATSSVGRSLDFAVNMEELAARLGWGATGGQRVNTPPGIWDFVPPSALHLLAGRLFLGDQMELLLDAEVDLGELKAKSSGLFSGASDKLEDLYRFCGRVFPQNVFACAYLRLDVKTFLTRLESMLDPDARDLLGVFVRQTRRRFPQIGVSTTAELVHHFGALVGNEVAIALEPQASYKIPGVEGIKVPNKSWGPRLALAFPVSDRAELESLVGNLVEAIKGDRDNIGKVYRWSFPPEGKYKFQEIEFVDPDYPTLALGFLDLEGKDYFVLTTTGQFLEEIYTVRLSLDRGPGIGLAESHEYKQAEAMVEGYGQGFLYGQSAGLRRVLSDLAEVMAENETRLDLVTLRQQITQEILRRRYPQYLRGGLPENIRRDLDGEVDAEIDRREDDWLMKTLPVAIEERRKNLAVYGLFRWAALTFEVGERDLQVKVRAATPMAFR